jgi:chromosome transmission fidelity protein 4
VFKTLRAGPYTRALAWEQEGTYVASLSADGHLQVWDIVSGKADCNMPKSAPKVYICPLTSSELNFLPRSYDGSMMSVACLCQYSPWSTVRLSCCVQIDRSSHERGGLAWHPDGSLLAVAGTSNNVVIYERLSWDPLYELEDAHSGPVKCLEFSPNGKRCFNMHGSAAGSAPSRRQALSYQKHGNS